MSRRAQNVTGVDIMDDEDAINAQGDIIWSYSRNKTSMTKLSKHLRISTSNNNEALRKLKETPAIKEPFDDYLRHTRGLKHHWKPNQLVAAIQEDMNGPRKLVGYKPDTQAFTSFEWTAYVLEKIKSAILNDRNGPFFRKDREEAYLYTRAWSLIRHMRWDSTESRRGKRAVQSRRIASPSQGTPPETPTTESESTVVRTVRDEATTTNGENSTTDIEEQPSRSENLNVSSSLPRIQPAEYIPPETVPHTTTATNTHPSTTTNTTSNTTTTTTTTTTVTATSIITTTTIVVVQKRPDLIE